MRAVALRLSATMPSLRPGRDQVLRFRRSERLVHWALAVPFMVCYSTALILVAVYNPDPTRPFRQVVSWTHRTSGLCLFILPLWTLFRNRHEAALHAHNIRQVWRWTRDDLKWLLLVGPASLSARIALPHQGKFNAGEKINFMSVSSTYSIYILTGLGIWLGIAPVACWLVHFSLAACATPLLVGHILMATVNPDTRPGLTGMITGFVDREWASHHYHHWYHQHFGKHDTEPTGRRGAADGAPLVPFMPARVAAPVAHAAATARCPARSLIADAGSDEPDVVAGEPRPVAGRAASGTPAQRRADARGTPPDTVRAPLAGPAAAPRARPPERVPVPARTRHEAEARPLATGASRTARGCPLLAGAAEPFAEVTDRGVDGSVNS